MVSREMKVHSQAHRRRLALASIIGAAAVLLAAVDGVGAPPATRRSPSASGLAGETSYLAENDAAMAKMMRAMTVTPTGDADRDFVEMMVPHHQGAIDMAVALLRHGHNEKLRRLAQEIIVTQQQEIAAMRLAVGEPLPPSKRSPTQPSLTPPRDHRSTLEGSPMSSNMRMK